MMVQKNMFVAIALFLAVSVQGSEIVVAGVKPPITILPTTTPPTTKPSPKPDTTTPSTTETPTTVPTPGTTTPLPPADTGKWAYTDPKNTTCVIVQMAIQMNITYQGNDSKPLFALFDLPVNSTHVLDGSCGNDSQYIKLRWPVSPNVSNSLILNFMKNTTTDKFALSSLEADIVQDGNLFPGSKNANQTLKLVYSHESFTTPLSMSYRCAKPQSIVIETQGMPNSTIQVNSMQLQAFHSDKGNSFGNANDCDYVDVPDVVPIAVGCALGALVLIVLIAYLVGRRRSQARGYLSM